MITLPAGARLPDCNVTVAALGVNSIHRSTVTKPNIMKIGITSVLVPLYNHETTVERALTSILLSDCKKIELIICDDASVDQSFEVASLWCKSFGNRFESVQIVKNAINLGINKNFNKLMSLSLGEFVTLLASDDELTHFAIDKQRSYLLNNPNKDFVFANWGLIDQNSRLIKTKVVNDWRAKLINLRPFSLVDIVFEWGLPWAGLFARRNSFAKLGIYPEEISFEDRWSALKIAQTGRFGYLHETAFLYRVRGEGTATGGIDPTVLMQDMRMVERLIINESTGLLKILLLIRQKSFYEPGKTNTFRLFWLLVRKMVGLIYVVLILGN